MRFDQIGDLLRLLRSKVTQGHGHARSSEVIKCKNKKFAISPTLLNFYKIKYVTLAYSQGKSSDHIMCSISGSYGYVFLA